MDISEVIRTTFAAREFTDDPVPDSVIERMLEHARFAPSGGNRQGWYVIVVRDPETRAAIAQAAERPAKRYVAMQQAGEGPWNAAFPSTVTDESAASVPTPRRLMDPYIEAPVLLAVCVDLGVVASVDKELDRVGVISGGSIYPFVWSLLLMARDQGYGGTLTTIPIANEPELKPILGLPDHYAIAAFLPIGKPVKQLTRLKRGPVEEFATIDRFDGEPFGD
ncbi:MAG: nitroreductase family protein [Chloroflexi bacterium]|nr:nitroreductase family protein [Chloroflexota bacterium]MCY3696869.1 nitroreductase family protein [Chloroflexota bacterium]MXX81598.1 nitroreductase family protein [Chloroflexota bacterium]MYF22635.1 nitroreductase family protein [Chloroflexota bacterium]